ncbi:MAG: cysteine desulfurase family protein [Bacteroidota bacterium]
MDIHPVIYLDYNATTPVAPEVVNEMLPFFLSAYGNASSNDHLLGWQAKDAVDQARSSFAHQFGIGKNEIIFTSGATEAINLLLRGLLINNNASKTHIITVETEHSAVLGTCEVLLKNGLEVEYLPVNEQGIISLERLEKSIRGNTQLVSIMMVNNETGVLQPMKEIGEICKRKNVLFMSDTTQAIGKIDFRPIDYGIDIMVGSAHKFYGPKGVGFLYARKEILDKVEPLITGGGQEGAKRGGTTNVPAIVGMAKALELNLSQLESESKRIRGLQISFEEHLVSELPIIVHAKEGNRMYNVSNICFKGIDSERLMQKIGGKVAASRGSACSSAGARASHVLSAMGVSHDDALSSVRFSFGRFTSEDDLEKAIDIIVRSIKSLSVGV